MTPLFSCHREIAIRTIGYPIAMSILVFALSGCASLSSKTSAPVAAAMPAAWSGADVGATTGTSTLAQWWSRFDDPLLDSLVTQSLQANTSVTSAQAALRQARALRDVAAAGLWPTLGISASAQHRTSGNGAGNSAGNNTSNSSSNNFNVGLDASWELDIFGAKRSALDAGDATVQASAANLGDVQVSIAAEVAIDYITLRGAQSRLIVASNNLASQQETEQIVQWRYQAGLVTSLEAEQALAAAEQTGAQLPVLQTSIDQTSHALAVLTGQPPAALSVILADTAPVPHAADNLTLNIPAETLRQRPDVRAAEHQITAALARVAQADAARWPDFRLSGSVGLTALTVGALGNSGSVVSSLLAGVSMPLFDGGALRAQVRAQQAALDQARVAYQAAILTALKDVEDALTALRGDRERLVRLQRAAVAADNASVMARQRFSSGLVDFQIVLETQRTQFNTQDNVTSANTDVSADHVRLYKALGGGWNENISTSPNETTSNPIEDFTGIHNQ